MKYASHTTRLLGVLILGLLLISIMSWESSGGVPSAAGVPRKRVEFAQRFRKPWSAECEVHRKLASCEIAALASRQISTSRVTRSVDVEVSATLNYRISAGDGAKLSVIAVDVANGVKRQLRLGPFPLASPPRVRRSTTTIVWFAKGLPAEGRGYDLILAVEPVDRSGDQEVYVDGNKLTLVIDIEMHPE
jgi:hypothetical protein